MPFADDDEMPGVDTPKFNPADVVPDPCPNDCGYPTEDPGGGPCRECWDIVNDPDSLEHVGADLQPDWRA